MLDGKEGTKEIKDGLEPEYVVKRKIENNHELLGWALVMEKKGNLTRVNQAYGQLAILIGALALLGWIAIYFLSKRLAHPIKQVAETPSMYRKAIMQLICLNIVRKRKSMSLFPPLKIWQIN